jgi:hypothetical protein
LGLYSNQLIFFSNLSEATKINFIEKIKFKEKDVSIEKISKYLYELRSKFMHEANLILNLVDGTHTNVKKNKSKVILSKLSIADLMLYFEEGLIIHFKK